MRSEGFSLFIAVCTQPADQKRYIKLLDESIPDMKVVTVELTKETVNALDRVTKDARTKNCGALMVTGFEKVLSSDTEDHPLLNSLNLSRPEWPARLPFPVVFWVPEYILGILGRKTPDFLDWRSDTIYFPSLSEAEYEPLLSASWMGGDDGRMDKKSRRERIRELRSRIKLHTSNSDRAAQSALGAWWNELGNHMKLFGELDEAESAFSRSLVISEDLGRSVNRAVNYGNLALIYTTRGDLDRAEEMHKKSLEIYEKLGQLEGLASQYGNLGIIYQTRGDLDRAEKMQRKSLEIHEKLGRPEGIAADCDNLGVIYGIGGDLDRAEEMLNKSLEFHVKLGRLRGMATNYGNLGLVYQMRGDLDRAEKMFNKSLQIHEKLGGLEGMAISYGNLGIIYGMGDDLNRAEKMFRKSMEINRKMDRSEGVAIQSSNLARLYEQRGETAKARSFYLEARDLYQRVGIPEEVRRVEGRLEALGEIEPRP